MKTFQKLLLETFKKRKTFGNFPETSGNFQETSGNFQETFELSRNFYWKLSRNLKTFDNLNYWLNTFQNHLAGNFPETSGNYSLETFQKLLVGNFTETSGNF